MKDQILKWLFECENTGLSSKTMAAHFAGFRYYRRSYPQDPADFNRCLTFLKWVPEARSRLNELGKISKTWKKLVDRWDEIEKCFLEEVGLDWSKGEDLKATNTYNLMKSILEE
jgi:hypothetical protein